MRTIRLFSTAFNMNKKNGKEVMRRAEEFYLTPDEQSGFRRKK